MIHSPNVRFPIRMDKINRIKGTRVKQDKSGKWLAEQLGICTLVHQSCDFSHMVCNRVIISALVILLALPLHAQVTTDKVLFDKLDLGRPGLETVRADVDAGNLEAAKHDFVRYLKTRTNVKWYFDWRKGLTDEVRNPGYDTSTADKYASNLLVSTGFWHQFGPVVDWHANPTPNEYHEWTWQLSRHDFWPVLGKAYWATGDEKYARAFVSQMRSWVEQNPLPKDDTAGPYSCWRTIEAGIRTFGAWPNAFFYFLSSPSFDDESIIMMVKSFYEHTQHLLKYPKHNNWLTMEMDGLFHTAMVFPEFKEAGHWASFASNRLYEEEKIQFYPDGAQVELSTGYHGVSVSNMVRIYPIARLNSYPLPETYLKGLENAYQIYELLMMPDGNYPALNDSGFGNCRSSLAEAYKYYPEREDFRYLATSGKEGTAPSFTSCWMPWAGWYMMRSGWDSNALYANMEVGPYGAGHQHEDKLSVILSAYGRLLLTEGGIYAYDSSPWRKYVLSARAHNIARVDGKDQYRGGLGPCYRSDKPLDNRWISNDRFDFGEGWYTEGFGPERDSTVTHYRALLFARERGYWLLVDVFSPKDTKVHSYDTWFHFNSDSCEPVLGGYTSADAGSANLAIIPLDTEGVSSKVILGQEDPEVQGWIPKGQVNISVPVPVATPSFHQEGAGVTVIPYVLCPSKPGEEPRVSKVKSLGRGRYKIYFKDGSCDRIRFSFDGHALNSFSLNGKLF